MMQFIFLFFGLVDLFSLALAASTAFGSLPYPVEVVQYTGSLGGYDIQLNGTVQEIYAQMKVLHPDFNPNSPGFAPDLVEKNLTSRASLNKDGVFCCPVSGQDWKYTAAWAIQDGIDYLNGLGRINIFGRTCGRISCSNNSAIYLCNDNDVLINPAATYLATYASDLMDNCPEQPRGWLPLVCGQEFDSDHYNIIVREDSC